MSLGGSGTHIYTGPWIDWSEGPVFGSIITLSQRDSQILGSFLAAFVAVVGAQLWKIITFASHQARANRGPSDGIHHQQQVILRNSASAAGAAWSFTQQAIFWRKSGRRPFLRTLPWALFAVLYLIVFAILSVFTSSEITTAHSTKRLVRGAACGYLNTVAEAQDNPNGGTTTYSLRNLNSSIVATNYARNCYLTGDTSSNLNCGIYPVPNIPFTTNPNAPCPFAEGACKDVPNNSFSMDSGLIDSLYDLGINTQKHERVQYRKVATCAVADTTNFVQNVTVTAAHPLSNSKPGDDVFVYNYGPVGGFNYSYVYNYNQQIDGSAYSVISAFAINNGSSGFFPIPAFNRTDADVTIAFISSNSLSYSYPSNDPIFPATIPLTLPGSDGSQNITIYAVDRLVSPIVCADSHQICNPNTGACTDLLGAQFLLQAAAPNVGLSHEQVFVMERIFSQAIFSDIYYSIFGRDASALLVSETVDQNIQTAPIPDNQWTIEVSNWFATGLARIQQGILEFATGPPNTPQDQLLPFTNDFVKGMCDSQKVSLADGTVSFSVLGMALVLAIGFAIIFFSIIQETLVGFVQRRLLGRNASWRNLNWVLDDKLQLQRMLYETLGLGGEWKYERGPIPVTRSGDKFGGWDNVDDENPRLSKVVQSPGFAEEQRPFMSNEKGNGQINNYEV